MLIVEAVVSLLLVAAGVFALAGSIGLVRLQDVLQRMHAPTKCSTLGLGAALCASAVWFTAQTGTPRLGEFLITAFVFLTAPVSAQLLAQAALHLGLGDRKGLDDPPR
jgi:multicomponent K+:H+ antiporter subunit G